MHNGETIERVEDAIRRDLHAQFFISADAVVRRDAKVSIDGAGVLEVRTLALAVLCALVEHDGRPDVPTELILLGALEPGSVQSMFQNTIGKILKETPDAATDAMRRMGPDFPSPEDTPNAREIVERHAAAGNSFAQLLIDDRQAIIENFKRRIGTLSLSGEHGPFDFDIRSTSDPAAWDASVIVDLKRVLSSEELAFLSVLETALHEERSPLTLKLGDRTITGVRIVQLTKVAK